jgi:phage/plasmid-associated DNA primase
MKLSDSSMRRFLDIQSHERFANIYFKFSTTPLVVLSKKDIFMYNTEFKYYQHVDQAGRLMSLVSDVLHKALNEIHLHFKNKLLEVKTDAELDQSDKDEALNELKTVIKQVNTATKNIETTTFIKNILEQIISRSILSKEQQEKLERLDNHLNFRNGKLDLKTMEFSERTEADFVTEYLNYDFQLKVNKEVKNEVVEVLKKICNSDDDDYEFITNFLAYCITSETKEQKYLNVVGPSASNGKSTIIKLMEEALSIYIFKAKKDLFSEAYSKGHKYFAQTKNKRIVYIEELDKKKVDADLIKDVVDGNKINNEVLFATTEKIDINFKLMFLSNNLMNFDADSGIKRRLIHFEFRNKFVALQDLEKERINHKIGKVFALDNSLVSKFHNNDSYKNALIHILIKKAKQYFDNGLTIPDKYVEIAKEICEENDKFKNFFENHFEITNKDEDRIAKDELRDMYNSYTKCNFSASSIMTDIQRLQLKYERGLRCVYNNVSLRGVIVGIKKLTGKVEPNKPEVKHSDLDFGLDMEPEPEIAHNSEYTEKLEKDLKEKNNQFTELQIEHDNLKKEFEAMKLKLKEIEKQNQRPDSGGMERYYYNLWFETLSEEEQKVELQIKMYEKKSYVEEDSDEEKVVTKNKSKSPPKSIEIEEDSDEEKVITKKKSKSPLKSIISMIDDSDDEDEKVKPVNAKDHKILKALECDFID